MIAVGYPVFLGSELILGRDSGARESAVPGVAGPSFTAAKKVARDADAGGLEIRFCSTRCLHQFLMVPWMSWSGGSRPSSRKFVPPGGGRAQAGPA